MITAKPSCIKEIKRLAKVLFSNISSNDNEMFDRIKVIINKSDITDVEKLLTIKQLCEDYAKRDTKHLG